MSSLFVQSGWEWGGRTGLKVRIDQLEYVVVVQAPTGKGRAVQLASSGETRAGDSRKTT